MNYTRVLADFLAQLTYEQIPASAVLRTEELFLDWLGSALASKSSHPIPLFEQYAAMMGPSSGPSTILVSGETSSPYFAALVNGASSHLVEQMICTTAQCCTLQLSFFRQYSRQLRSGIPPVKN